MTLIKRIETIERAIVDLAQEWQPPREPGQAAFGRMVSSGAIEVLRAAVAARARATKKTETGAIPPGILAPLALSLSLVAGCSLLGRSLDFITEPLKSDAIATPIAFPVEGDKLAILWSAPMGESSPVYDVEVWRIALAGGVPTRLLATFECRSNPACDHVVTLPGQSSGLVLDDFGRDHYLRLVHRDGHDTDGRGGVDKRSEWVPATAGAR